MVGTRVRLTAELRKKVRADMPLNKQELMAATGIGRWRMEKIDPPYRCGLIRWSDWLAHWHSLELD